MIVATILLAAALYPGPERSITPPVADASPYDQSVGDVDTGGDVALTVWNENGSLAGVRIDRDGTLLDARPLILSTGPADWPNVVRGDGNWLVTWLGAPGHVLWRFVDDEGTMSDAVPVAPVNGANALDAAFDGRNFLLAWNEGTSIEAVRLGGDGALLEHSISIPARGWFDSLSVVALDGGGFAAGTIQTIQSEVDGYAVREDTVEVFRLNRNADVVSSGLLDRTTTAVLEKLRLATDGRTIVGAWTGRGIFGGGEDLVVAREGEAPRVVVTDPAPYALVRNAGTVYVVAVNPVDGSTLLISEDGTERRTIAGASRSAAAASFGDRLILTTSDGVGSESDVAAAVLDATLRDVAPRRRLTFAPALQERPAVACNAAGEALVAWVESGRAEGAAIVAARVDPHGNPVGNAFVVAQVPWAFEVRPHVVSDGSGFLVAWHEWDGKGVRARRVSREGTVTGEPLFVPYEVYTGAELCAAWTGTEYLLGSVVAVSVGHGERHVAVRVTPVSAEGGIGETRRVIPVVRTFRNLACASGAAGTLVVAAGTDVQGVLLDPNGNASAPVRISDAAPAANLGIDVRPAAAANGRSFLVAWDTFSNAIEWAIVNEHGTVTRPGEELPLDQSEPTVKALAVAPHGDGYVLVWGTRDLRAITVDAAGHAVSAGRVSETPLLDREPALAGGGTSVLAAYTRDIGSELRPQLRVFTRTISESMPRRRSARH